MTTALCHVLVWSISLVWLVVSGKTTQYTNHWVVKVPGGPETAARVARDMGYTYKQPVFDDHYVLVRGDLPDVAERDSSHLTDRLMDLQEVEWAEQQPIVERSKRLHIPVYQERSTVTWTQWLGNYQWTGSSYQRASSDAGDRLQFYLLVLSDYFSELHPSETIPIVAYPFSSYWNLGANTNQPEGPKDIGKANFDSIPDNAFSTAQADDALLDTYHGVTKHPKCPSRRSSPYEDVFNDPKWDDQWYVQDCRVRNSPVMDHNVVAAYKRGYTGKNIVIMIPDEGIQENHVDLAGNIDSDLCFDFCQQRPGCGPVFLPGATQLSEGTMSAGIVAMVANNKRCGVGIAYHSKVSGARVLCSQYSVYTEAQGLVHELPKVHIYSIAWGEIDDGKMMSKINYMLVSAITKGITEGRDGKGAIYLFGAGSGKKVHDNCGADGLANHVGLITIGSASSLGKPASYSERCAAILATTYSGDRGDEVPITTGDNNQCLTDTPANLGVPLASGIVALALHANPDLTYRDLMHLIVMTAEVAPLADNDGDTWHRNSKGFWVSNDFGFGLLNAGNMVKKAENWKTVPEQHVCTETIHAGPTVFVAQEGFKVTRDATGCQDDSGKSVKYIEHVVLTTTIQFPYRGAISVYLKSPTGMKTTLLEPRPQDNDNSGLREWDLKSVHNWGEDPKGRWTVMVKILSVKGLFNPSATAEKFTLTFYGTETKPDHYEYQRKYASFRLSDDRTSNME